MAGLDFVGLRLDAYDAERIATFWAQLLGWRLDDRTAGVVGVVPDVSTSFPLVVHSARTPKNGQNRIHLDLTTATPEAMRQSIARARDLGAVDVDIGQSPDEPHTVLADPEGNEFCVIHPENTFLADTGAVGAINCDGTQAVGYFWSNVLAWPLVWDQDQETAIRSPYGGPKVTWGGPPLMTRPPRPRWRFDLLAEGDAEKEAERLVSLGATLLGPGVLADPDGNDFRLLPH